MRHRIALISALFALAFISTSAQVRPIYNQGAAGLSLLIGRLQTVASALHTGAHPDDEDSGLIARLARGDYARVAYLSLNRGEGGQNIIGTELFEGLGVIRTEELLQARRLDGGEQFFTRTFDYGFSKTRAEAAARWGEQDVLGDMVRVIRMYRPIVIASRFSGTPADGHGQHQLAGYLTPLAFKAAADPAQFPEQIREEGLHPWQAAKLYVGQGFRPDPNAPPTTQIATGAFDPVIGRSHMEIAMEGRSQHKSQEMGVIELRGPQQSALRLIARSAEAFALQGNEAFALQGKGNEAFALGGPESSLFDGVDVSVAALGTIAGLPAGMLKAELAAVASAAAEASKSYVARAPGNTIPALAKGVGAVRAARAALKASAGKAPAAAVAHADFLLDIKEREFSDALVEAAGVDVDPLANSDTVNPGGTLGVTVRAFLAEPALANVGAGRLDLPAGWMATAGAPPAADDRDPFARFFREAPPKSDAFTVRVPADAKFTQPYWLEQPRKGDLFQWAPDAPKGMPFAPPLIHARVPVTIGGVTVDVARPVQFRYADRIRGEIRRYVNVVPAVDVGLDSRLLIVSTSAAREHRVVVRLGSYVEGAMKGVARLTLPAGWTATPAEQPFALPARGAQTAATFTVKAPANVTAGTYDVSASAIVEGRTYQQDVQTIAYPHIQTHRWYQPSTARAQAFDVTVAPVRVGYLMGSGDQVPDAIRRLGVNVELIDSETLSTGDLSRFDTIVVGIRASEGRPEFVANNGRLLQYVENGGTLIVQYQQTDYTQRGLAPFPGEIGPRVTDETAPVTILKPDHPVLTFPNRITSADFQHWVQERNLYSFGKFDSRYTPLLAANDPGEPENQGGMLYAELGKGRFVYTSYSWFRQLPAGVPGAYRIFANLLSLSKAGR